MPPPRKEGCLRKNCVEEQGHPIHYIIFNFRTWFSNFRTKILLFFNICKYFLIFLLFFTIFAKIMRFLRLVDKHGRFEED